MIRRFKPEDLGARRNAGLGANLLTPLEGGWHGEAQGALGAEAQQTVRAIQERIFGPPQGRPWGDPLTPLEGEGHGEAREVLGLRLDRS
eukprot:SM000326S12435  [mRNA]  locus=s326:10166:16271:- [translate_table: standard]